mmetsp:Transcript_10744/g.31770  ORF Transcript_10744/g.31770 Transcript_10744/m.31770 type:complete len:202 (+) Transcript_10744:606-1211(+)
MSKRPLFISLAMRTISSSRSSMQLRVPPSSSGSIATQLSVKLLLTCEECCMCRDTNSCSQHSAVSLEHASVAKQHLTTMPVVSETICRAFCGGLETTPLRSSFRQASALCRMSRMWSPNMLKSPSRYCGRYRTMSTSGFFSSRVIQASTSCRMKGFLYCILEARSGTNFSTWNLVAPCVTMSFISRSRTCTPLFTSLSTSA